MRSEQVWRAARRDGRVLSNTDCVYGVWHTGDNRDEEAGGGPGTEPKGVADHYLRGHGVETRPLRCDRQRLLRPTDWRKGW